MIAAEELLKDIGFLSDKLWGLCRDLRFHWLQPVYLKGLWLVFLAYYALIHPV